MSARHRIILINGPIGVGKTWLANKLRERSLEFQSDFRRRADIVGFADPIRETIRCMFPMRNLDTADEWRTFKDAVLIEAEDRVDSNRITDFTGRDLMILIGNTLRAHDPSHWIKVFLHHVRMKDSKNLYGFLHICDDWGFENEFQVPSTQPDFDILSVYIGESMVTEGPLRQFDNDSRFDLSRYSHIRAPNSSVAFEKVCQAITNRGWNK